MTEPSVVTQVVSKRAVTRLAELQHQLSQQMQMMSAHHSRFLGALMACDAVTQRTMMMEYRDQLHEVHSILSKICLILDRYGDPEQD